MKNVFFVFFSLAVFSLVLFSLGAGACGGTSSAVFGPSADGGTSEGGVGPMPQGSFVPGAPGAPGAPNAGTPCSAAAMLIYVLSDANDLYGFDPTAKVFTKIGTLGCTVPTGQWPNSMAIDRSSVAWVNYVGSDKDGSDSSGAIYQVSTQDASCIGHVMDLPVDWYRLGMAFATDAPDAGTETLYVASSPADVKGHASAELGRIDTTGKTLVPIGAFTGNLKSADAELTGTGDARLYAFFATTPVEVVELDPKTGAPLGAAGKIAGIPTPNEWAFSFWGGDFYLYTAPDPTLVPGAQSNVTQYGPDGSTNTSYLDDIGFRIVGAGVSTCAPVTAPALK